MKVRPLGDKIIIKRAEPQKRTESGIYLPEFGVRSEVNVVLTSERAEISGAEPQRELLRLLG